MNTPDDAAPLDGLEDDDRDLVEAIREQVFGQLVFDCGGDEVKANQLFSCLIMDAFANHLIFASDPDDPRPASDPENVAAMANAKLTQAGVHWRIVQELLP